jgi:hypothetical protein
MSSRYHHGPPRTSSLDPGKLRNLIVKGGGLWRATPDMRLVRLFKEPGGDGLSRAEQMLEELAKLGV